MKQLKSSAEDLRNLFTSAITVRHIAESLASFDAGTPVGNVASFMAEKDYDLIGVRRKGLVVGYARKEDLTEGSLGDHLIDFEPAIVIPDTDPILRALEILKNSSAVFVSMLGQVAGIVTRGDLQKAPIRMWLFGLVSLIEMQVLRIIREAYPDDSWQGILSEDRLNKARELVEMRKERNEAIDLADCLQFCDKATIILKSKRLRAHFGIKSRKAGEPLFSNLQALRNDLAHSQDIITGQWPEIITLVCEAETFLCQAEKLHPEVCAG